MVTEFLLTQNISDKDIYFSREGWEGRRGTSRCVMK